MVDLTDYERRGDLDASFGLSKTVERAQSQAARNHDALRCDIPMLTWEQYSAGDPCPGCDRPYRGDGSWEDKGTMYYTDEEQAQYDEELTLFREKHADCSAMLHSVRDSLTMHCGRCCPPPPMSPAQRETVGRILSSPKGPEDLTRWRLRLFCGHVVERTAHYTHTTVSAAFSGAVRCAECGLDPATIIDSEAIGPASDSRGAP